MAIHAPITGTPIRASFVQAPPAAITRILSRFDRRELEGFISVALDLLDLADGDPDVELNGDEQDANGDDQGDQAWVEWHTMRGASKRGPNILAGQEDDEDDDPAEEDDPSGQCDEDEISTRLHAQWGTGAGCPISDPDYEGVEGR